jgi:hypothetical protein
MSANRPVILCCPTKNELHNLSRLVHAWRLYADHVVIADQMSTDGSREYLSQFQNVKVIDNLNTVFSETDRIQLLVDGARSISESAIILFLDADETLSSNVSTSLEWKSFQNAPAGTTGYFTWVQLWGSVRRYIARGSVGNPVHSSFAFIDDGRPLDGTGVMHGPRGLGMAHPERRFYFNDVVNMHFFLTNKEVYRKKQNWYKCYWLKDGKYFHINRNHSVYDKIGLEHTDLSPVDWYLEYERNGIDLFSTSSSELLWYDVDVLRYMNLLGERRLWLLDIWNQDWEYLRQLALQKGITDIPTTPVKTPPKPVLLYNSWTVGRTSIGDMGRSLRRYATRKILP